ncbi:hypothetical protein BJY04DRAFT_220618 [Aspergillus karnatakaensis]|uniref:uncharacterized protein n=1 Tax=Aspergillus karnatakaensis TaxID=1810916 RepID=UPI003CCC9555
MWRQRLMSAFLPIGEYSGYLLEQYQSIQDFCSVSLQASTYTSTLVIPSHIVTATATPTPNPPPTTATCQGQIVDTEDQALGCLGLADAYNVSSGALVAITGSRSCYFNSSICVPLPCQIDHFFGHRTCDELAARYSTDDFPISVTQLLAWNPHLQGTCDLVAQAQRLCRSPPGGYQKPSGVISAPTSPGEYYTTAIPAQPTQTGTVPDCGRFYKVESGDTCQTVALRFGITFDELQALNTYLRDDCANLWLDYDICVAPVTESPVSEDGTCGPAHENALCVAQPVDIAELVLITAALATASLAPVSLTMARQQMGHVAQAGDSPHAQILILAPAALYMVSVVAVMIIAGLGYATRGTATPILGGRVSMANVVRTSREIKLVQEHNSEIAVQYLGTVGVLPTTAVLAIAIRALAIPELGRWMPTGAPTGAALSPGHQASIRKKATNRRLQTHETEAEMEMDYQRCADLHNRIIGKGRLRPGKPLVTWWEKHVPSEEVTTRLTPSLIEFLKRAHTHTALDDATTPFFFYFLSQLSPPDDLLSDSFLKNVDEERYVLLYTSSHWKAEDTLGLAFDLHTSTAILIADYNECHDICLHAYNWLPLETILEGYLDMIDHGKVAPVSVSDFKAIRSADPHCPTHIPPWVLYRYTPTDVEKAVTALKRLLDAIENRLPEAEPNPDQQDTARDAQNSIMPHFLPWSDPSTFTLRPDLTPPKTFAFEFLKSIASFTVPFRYIAPGIRFPTAEEFLAQSSAWFPGFPGGHPLRIFQVDLPTTAPASALPTPIPRNHPYPQGSRPGFYITQVHPYGDWHFANESHLSLPFKLGGNGYAVQSSGEPLGYNIKRGYDAPENSGRTLYQSGYPTGFTDWRLVQVHKVLENWAEMVEEGLWGVDGDGVAGGIEVFREADTEEGWEDYVIPLSW